MSFINLDGSNYDKGAIAAGRVTGAESWSRTGHVENLLTTDTNVLVSDSKAVFSPLSAASALEVVSDNVNDTSAGSGARTVLIELIDSTYARVFQVVTLNGTTPVVVPGGPYFFVNRTLVLTAGGTTNTGNISVRVSGGGALQDYIKAGVSTSRALKYQVPVGYRLIIDNFYVNPNTAPSASRGITLLYVVKTSSGVELITQTNYLLTDTVPLNLTLPTGLVLTEKSTLMIRVASVTANGLNLAISLAGFLVTNPS